MNELNNTFSEITEIIEQARSNAYRKVNEELILMYQRVGKFLSEKSEEANYGDGYIDSLADYIQNQFPGIKGFNRRGLYRMKQFYETYAGNEKVSALLTQLSWTNHLLIMSGSKSDEEREFYIRLAIKERYSSRQLERQIDSGYYERYMLSRDKLLPEAIKSEQNPFLDSYVVEFLDLPDTFHENDFRRALVRGMRDFILELGKDFTFVGEEYPIQVGGEDYRIDLLFFHRSLRCLVAIELKVGKFKPEYVSKMDFYLEGLDRQIKKQDENPSVGLILCASKDDEVVEYAMSRTLSPMMVAQYQLQLPDKDILRKKLQELANLPDLEGRKYGRWRGWLIYHNKSVSVCWTSWKRFEKNTLTMNPSGHLQKLKIIFVIKNTVLCGRNMKKRLTLNFVPIFLFLQRKSKRELLRPIMVFITLFLRAIICKVCIC